MKPFLLSSAFLILLASSAAGTAADCYRTDPDTDLLPSVPPGVVIVPNGYHCVDSRGQYIEVRRASAPAELVIPSNLPRGTARIEPRPAARSQDLLPNGLRRPAG